MQLHFQYFRWKIKFWNRKLPDVCIYSWKGYFMKIKVFSQQIKFLTHDALKQQRWYLKDVTAKTVIEQC